MCVSMREGVRPKLGIIPEFLRTLILMVPLMISCCCSMSCYQYHWSQYLYLLRGLRTMLYEEEIRETLGSENVDLVLDKIRRGNLLQDEIKAMARKMHPYVYGDLVAKLSQVPAKLDWGSLIITIPVFRIRPCPSHGKVSKQQYLEF